MGLVGAERSFHPSLMMQGTGSLMSTNVICMVVAFLCWSTSVGAIERPFTMTMVQVPRIMTPTADTNAIQYFDDQRCVSTFDSLSALISSKFNKKPQTENFLCKIRGGATALDDEEKDNDDDNSPPGVLLSKVRNVIRNFLSFGDKTAPPLASLVRVCLKSIEGIIGVKLMPSKNKTLPTKKKKKNQGKSKTKSSSAMSKQKGKISATRKKNDEGIDEKDEGKVATGASSSTKKKGSKALKKPSAATKKHLSSNIKNTNPNYRIQRELKEFIKSPPPNLSVQVGSNIRKWVVTMLGAEGTIYEGEVFKLFIKFPPQYPTVPPSVYFLQGHIPTHEHVYTNGDICLSLLGKDWRPTMTAQSIAVSILSILSSAQSKSLPMDNARHASNKPGEYQKDWVYHDDNC